MRGRARLAAVARPDEQTSGRSVRRSALARVAGWFDRAQAGEATVGLVSGGAGMGKTMLAQDAATIARHLGFVTVAVEGHAAGTSALVRAELAEQLSLPADEPDGRFPRMVRAEVQRLSSRGRCIALVFEDVHLYGPSDLAIVQDLTLSPPSSRLTVIVTLRSAPAEHLPEHVATFVQKLDMSAHVEQLELAPLSFIEGEELIREGVSGAGATPRFVRDALDFTRGSPALLALLVNQIAALPSQERMQYFSGSRMLEALAPGPAIARSLRPRFAGFGGTERRVLDALAVWSLPARIEVLAALTDEPGEQIERALEELERAGVVEVPDPDGAEFEFCEPMVAWVLRAEMPVVLRRRLHGRALDLLARSGQRARDEDLLLWAYHHLFGPARLDEEAAERVVRAARNLVSRSRFESARELINRLLHRLEDEGNIDGAPPAAFVLLAETLSRSGAMRDANRMIATAMASGASAGVALSALRRKARDHIALGRDSEALAIYQQILQSGRVDERTRVEVLIDAGHVQHMLGEPESAIRGFRLATALGDELDDTVCAAEGRLAHALILVTRGCPSQALPLAREAYMLARSAGQPPLLGRATVGIGNVFGDLYSLQRALRWTRRALRIAEACDDYATVSWNGARLAMLYLEMGEWERAEAAADASFSIDAGLHRIRALRRSRAVQSMLHALRGRSDPLDTRLSETFQEAQAFGGPSIFVPDLVARFEHQMLAGDFQAAERTIGTAHDLLTQRPGWERSLVVEVLPRQARLHAATGSIAGLEQVLDEFASLREGVAAGFPLLEAESMHANARLCMEQGEWDAAAMFARRAATEFGVWGYRWREAIALQDAGLAFLNLRATGEATTALEEAYAAFEHMGALRRLAAVRQQLQALGRRGRRTASRRSTLTARQWQIAELATRGLTDAEIAESLGISRRTVTTHMHNILRELDLHSRVELGAWTEANEADRGLALSDMM